MNHLKIAREVLEKGCKDITTVLIIKWFDCNFSREIFQTVNRFGGVSTMDSERDYCGGLVAWLLNDYI